MYQWFERKLGWTWAKRLPKESTDIAIMYAVCQNCSGVWIHSIRWGRIDYTANRTLWAYMYIIASRIEHALKHQCVFTLKHSVREDQIHCQITLVKKVSPPFAYQITWKVNLAACSILYPLSSKYLQVNRAMLTRCSWKSALKAGVSCHTRGRTVF